MAALKSARSPASRRSVGGCTSRCGQVRHSRALRERLRDELYDRLRLPGAELARGAGGIAEGLPANLVQAEVPKFREGGLLIVHAGGTAGLFSAIVGGWSSGPAGSEPVTREID